LVKGMEQRSTKRPSRWGWTKVCWVKGAIREQETLIKQVRQSYFTSKYVEKRHRGK